MNAKDERGLVAAVLRGHVSAETAFVEEDYPDGFVVRCKRRHWIETAEKGSHKGESRHVTQTSDERHGHPEDWRNPKKSTYVSRLWLVQFENGHADTVGMNLEYFTTDRWVTFYNTGIWPHLNPDERDVFTHFAYASRKRSSPYVWKRFDQLTGLLGTSLERPPSLEKCIESMGYVSAEDYAAMLTYLRADGPLFK